MSSAPSEATATLRSGETFATHAAAMADPSQGPQAV
jgi:hypothetical protein